MSAMNLEGRIDVCLSRQGAAPVSVSIQSSRPQLAQKLLAGRTPEEAAHLAGLIFSLCGKAQRIAAQAACEAAQGMQPDALARREREAAVLLELAQEHAWRLLLNWPQQAGAQLGITPDMASLLKLRQASSEPQQFAETLDILLQTTLLGEPAAMWLAHDLAAFDAWRRQGKTPTACLFAELGEGADAGISQASLLPSLGRLDDATASDLARLALENPLFCAQPLWRGVPAETGALARQIEHPLLAAWIAQRGRGAGARLLARLLELAALPMNLSGVRPSMVQAWRLDDNTGLAGIETSRGLLLHIVRLQAGKVVEYRIVAPTEWNFHPAGPLVQALSSLAPDGDLAARARLVAQSLDPCVEFGIDVTD
jgi:hypothetical protein